MSSSTTNSTKMGVIGLTIIVAVNMMGSGIIMLPASLAKVGTISVLSWLVTAAGSMALAYSFAQCGFFVSRSGGMSAYAEEAHGKSAFFMASYTYYVSLAIANVAIAITAVGYLSPFVPCPSGFTLNLARRWPVRARLRKRAPDYQKSEKVAHRSGQRHVFAFCLADRLA